MAESAPKPYTAQQERVATVAVRIMSVLNTWIFRASGGRLGSRFLRGAPVLLQGWWIEDEVVLFADFERP